MTLKEISMIRQAQVTEYQQSGQSMEAWCNEHQVNLYTLRYWLSKLSKVKQVSKKVPPVPWVALSSIISSPAEEPGVITIRMGAAVLSIAPGFDPLLLRQVLQVLQEI